MANGLFQPGGLLGPVAPGLPGAVNPLALVGFGIGQGTPLQSLQTMGNLSLEAQQMRQDEAYRAQQVALEAQQRQQQLLQRETIVRAARAAVPDIVGAMAPGVAEEQVQLRTQQAMDLAEVMPESVLKMRMSQLFPQQPKPTAAMIEAQQLYPDDPAAQADYITRARLKPLVQQTIGERSPEAKLQADIVDARAAGDEKRAQQLEAAAAKKFAPTVEQTKDFGHFGKMQGAETELAEVMAANPKFNPAATGEKVGDIPYVGNLLASPAYRQYKAAAREWIAGSLRKDSGAAVTEVEFNRDFNTYFPQVGDDAQTIAKKRKRRIRRMRDVYKANKTYFNSALPNVTGDDDPVYQSLPSGYPYIYEGELVFKR